jgi:hypothetical protein
MYRQKVRAPIGVWLFAGLIAGSLGVATGAALGQLSGWIIFAVLFLPAALLLQKSTVTIEVTPGELRVDQARLPLQFAGDITPLDKAAARRQRGPELDPACHLVLRGWVSTAIRIEVIDPDDSVPYWYISTRDPEGLKRAIDQQRV